MKISTPELERGYNAIVAEDNNKDMNMDFGVLSLVNGDSADFDDGKECVYVLITGKVTFHYAGQDSVCIRNSCFYEDPVVLHVPADTPVRISCMSDRAELTVHRTANSRKFPARLLKGEDLLCISKEQVTHNADEGTAPIVRTFFDRSVCSETNFYMGEVVSYPGKWSSYPPHSHMEPEIYFYKFLPENGYGFAEMGEEAYKVRQNDLTCIANGVAHSQCTAPGYAEYYLWIIRLQDGADMDTKVIEEHAWVTDSGARCFPEI